MSKKTSTKKNPGTAGFTQPNPADKKTAMPRAQAKNVGKGAKTKKAGSIAPPIKSVGDITAFRKAKYGV